LQQWYKDGLIDQEFAVNNEAKALEKVSANLSGSYFAPAWDTGWNIANSIKNDPKAVWIVADIPAGPDGKQQRRGNPNTKGGAGLYANSPNGEAFIKYFMALNSHPEVSVMQQLGFEGYNYMINNEGIPVTPDDFKKPKYPYPGFKSPENKIGYLIKDKSKWTLMDKKFDATVSPLNREADKLVLSTSRHEVYNKFVGAPTPTMQSKWAVLKKQEDETFVKIIMGEPLSKFDEFVETWNTLGGTQVTEEVNAWYDSVK